MLLLLLLLLWLKFLKIFIFRTRIGKKIDSIRFIFGRIEEEEKEEKKQNLKQKININII